MAIEVQRRSQHNERLMSHYDWSPKRSSSSRNNIRILRSAQFARTAATILLLSLPTWGGGSHNHHPSPTLSNDREYILALATADLFLHAWQVGDFENGMILLSDRVRHSQDPDNVEQFFSGNSGRAFEITRGRGSRGRYRFSLVLLTATGSHVRRRVSEIVVISTGKNDWVVDKLP
jgi:hypothetical protein